VADLKFEQTSPRNPLAAIALPIVIALVILSAAIFFYVRHDAAETTFSGTVQKAEIYPVHTQFEHVFGTPGPDQTEDSLYVLAHVRIDNPSKTPLFIKDLTADYTGADDAPLHYSAIEQSNLERLFTGFPKMKALATNLGKPLLRETKIEPGSNAEGYLVAVFPITPDQWQKRHSATVAVDFYHQEPITLTIPK